MKPFLFLPLLLLGACTTYNEAFDCEPGMGVGCKSLGEVNRMVDRGVFTDVQEESFASSPHLQTIPGLQIWMAPEGGPSC